MRKLTIALLIILLITISILVLKDVFFKLKSFATVSKTEMAMLSKLGGKALKTLDVPVGAVLIYKDSIIGYGYNTVLKDSNAAGHAEINAISDALKKTGIEAFFKLNRKQLKLITTLEPCMMCKGAIEAYQIKNVIFLKQKSIKEYYQQFKQDFQYYLSRQKAQKNNLQDSLLLLHPHYHPEN
jgi:tRNA(Arg) A34 adenosine deaminase TadA